MVVQKLLLQEGVKRGLKASRDYSVSILGYDFIGLVVFPLLSMFSLEFSVLR